MKNIKVLLVTPTFDVHTHGPSNFARFLYNRSKRDKMFHLYILSQGLSFKALDPFLLSHDYRPSKLYKGFGNYRHSKYLMKVIDSHDNLNSFDCVIFNHGINALHTALNSSRSYKVINLVNDDEFLSINQSHDYLTKRWIYHKINRRFEFKACIASDKTIAVSKHIVHHLKLEYDLSPNNIGLLYQGVSLSQFKFLTDRQFVKGEIQILFVKSDYKRGGLSILLAALNLLPEYSFHLTVVGTKEKDFQKWVTQSTVKTNVRVFNAGRQKRSIVAELMHQHDILCIPSLREGLGVANIEGLATGISVVSSSAGGIPEVLADGQAGWMAEPGNSSSLAQKLRECIFSPQLRKEKSNFGLQWVKKHFLAEDMYHNFVKIVTGVINA